MKWYSSLSIRNKLIGIILFVTICALGLGFSLVMINDIRSFKNDMGYHTSVTAQVIGDYCVGPLLFQDTEGAEKILAKLESVPSMINAIVFDNDGESFAAFSRSNEPISISADLKIQTSQFIGNHLYVCQPIVYEKEYYGTIYLQASTRLLNQKIKNYLIYMILLMGGLILVSFLLAVHLQRIISKPILHLAHIVKKIARDKDYTLRLEKIGNDETGLLYDGFNNMLSQIQKQEDERNNAENRLNKNNKQLQKEITERKRAEKELDRFFTVSLDMFCIAGTDGYYKRVNPAFERILGYTAEEILAEPLVNFVHPDDRGAATTEVQNLSAGLDSISFENRLRCKDGSYKWMLWNSTCVSDKNLIYGTAHDITARKHAEEELARHREHLEDLVQKRTLDLTKANQQLQQEIEDRKKVEEKVRASEETYRIVVKQTGQMVYDYDIKTDKIRWLGAIQNITGCSPEKFAKVNIKEWEKLIHAEDRKHTVELLEKTMKNSSTFNMEYRFKHKNGSYINIMDNGVFLKNEKGETFRMLGTMKDVTEQKRIEEARQENEEKFQAISASAQDAIIIMDNNGKISYWNEAGTTIFGYSKEEIVGQALHTILAPKRFHEDFKKAFAKFQKSGEGNAVGKTIDLVGIKKGGAEFPFELSLSSVKIKNNWNAIGILRDITERKLGEEVLAARLRYEEGLAACSRTLLTGTETENAIAEALGYLLNAANTSRVYIFENFEDNTDGLCMRQTHEVCAKGVEPQIDNPVLQHAPYKMGFYRWRDRLSIGESINGLVETFPDFEREILEPQGILSLLVIPITVEGHWFGFIGFDNIWEKKKWNSEDIRALQTASEIIGIYIDRKRFEEMLRVSEERFRSLVENANDIIYSLTPAGILSYISPKFTDILGYHVSEYLGKPFMPLIHPDDVKDSVEWFRSGLKEGPSQTGFEFRFNHKDGSIRWMHGNSSILHDEKGKILEIIGVAHDFTQMKKILEDLEQANQHLLETQAQLVQSAKMASLGQLVAGIAHEINTPIGAVSSMQDTLFRTMENLKVLVNAYISEKKSIEPQYRVSIKIMNDAEKVIKTGTDRVINIVRRLRSFARLDEAELKTVDIHEGLEDTLTLIHHEIKHTITVKRNYSKIPPIACYPGKLNQVFLNLIVNAKQAIRDKGNITITTSIKNQKVHVNIRDTGVGINKKDIKKIFDPGFTTKGVGVGTGLGLSICYQIIRDHRGDIVVKSDINKGTTFTIILPMNLDVLVYDNEKVLVK